MSPIRTAEIIAVGSELTTGATRDTNSGDLAAALTALGVRVLRATAVPDDLPTVTRAFSEAIQHADLVVSTGGLGPTPDDLTREAIAAACGLDPVVDPELEAWLRGLFERRGLTMPDANLKQAWLVEGATALPNEQGTAPGWWLERPEGQLVVALPGPPREWRPIWRVDVVPRLQDGRLSVARAATTLRLTGIGESALVALIGEDVLRARMPQVATYARPDAVDLVISSESADRESAEAMVRSVAERLRESVGQYVFAEGDETWAEVLGRRLDGRTLAVVEAGTGGQLAALLAPAEYLRHAELVTSPEAADVKDIAARCREEQGVEFGLAVRATERRGDTAVRVAIATESGVNVQERLAFLGGDEGRRRAALVSAAALWQALRAEERPAS